MFLGLSVFIDLITGFYFLIAQSTYHMATGTHLSHLFCYNFFIDSTFLLSIFQSVILQALSTKQKAVRTNMMCTHCTVPLCAHPCFEKFHRKYRFLPLPSVISTSNIIRKQPLFFNKLVMKINYFL
jgi:hypothetical protein